jgi:hypothetical protein
MQHVGSLKVPKKITVDETGKYPIITNYEW